ncbi:hypothetical protein [Duganella sp. BuS-21]|uniref:hypothetical protein n=1 Tax=Duganella sp. BuS-21 TaxID=2943848 RepID=UPI0035A7300E
MSGKILLVIVNVTMLFLRFQGVRWWLARISLKIASQSEKSCGIVNLSILEGEWF